jgi:GNAT superfamily N-acetyltransferase
MKITITTINDETIVDFFSPCRSCLYWEAPNIDRIPDDEAFAIKQQWFKRTRESFGNCGKLLYINGRPAAYTQYCLPHLLERVTEYSYVLPVSLDALLISCLYVYKGYRKNGLGTRLLQAVVDEVKERGYDAVETYARDDSPNNCSGPTAFYCKNGFTIRKKKRWGHAVFSLVRCEFRV